MIACPIPISRSRDSTIPASTIESVEKNAAASSTTTTTPASRSGFTVNATPSSAASTSTTSPWTSARMPAANALPATSADRGVGVAISFASTPASRSQMIWMP